MLKIPFYPNSEDNTHCLQACVQMVLRYSYPNEDFTFALIDKLFRNDDKMKWSTPAQAVYAFTKYGLTSKYFCTIDMLRWAREGEGFVRETYEPDVAADTIKNVDFENDAFFIEWADEHGLFEMKKLEFNDVTKMFHQGLLVLALINTRRCENKSGYQGHFVVITDITDNKVVFHDPGLPPVENRIESKEDFMSAWDVPETDNTIILVYPVFR